MNETTTKPRAGEAASIPQQDTPEVTTQKSRHPWLRVGAVVVALGVGAVIENSYVDHPKLTKANVELSKARTKATESQAELKLSTEVDNMRVAGVDGYIFKDGRALVELKAPDGRDFAFEGEYNKHGVFMGVEDTLTQSTDGTKVAGPYLINGPDTATTVLNTLGGLNPAPASPTK
jgi:hypothetical protein